jgi:hypothetical protein
MELPPQPDPGDYIDDNGNTRMCYYDALTAWKAVCLAIIEAEKSHGGAAPAHQETKKEDDSTRVDGH